MTPELAGSTLAGTAWTVGRTDLRRRWRGLKANTANLLATAFAALFFVPFSLGGLAGAYFGGAALAGGELGQAAHWARLGAAAIWLFVAGFAGMRAYQQALRPDALDGQLTTISHRALLGGLVLSEATTLVVPFVAYVVVAAAAFAIGAGSVAAAPLVALAATLVAVTALPAGFVVAIVLRLAGTRSALLQRLRTVLVAVLGLAYFWLIVSGSFNSALAPIVTAIAGSPVGWLGDLALLGTVSDASALRAAGGVVASAIFLPVAGVALSRLGSALWYGDAAHVERQHEHAGSTGDDRLAGVLPAPVLGVVRTDWARARRAPATKAYLLYPVILLAGPIAPAVQTGSVPGSLALLAALSLAWATGAAFSLNVVGGEGAGLPTALLGASPGSALVGGHVLAGAVVGVPLTVLATVVAGFAAGIPLPILGTLAASALVLAAAAGPLATGVGVVLPRFEAITMGRSTRAIVPSLLAFVVYSVALVVVALPALIGHSGLIGGAIGDVVGVPLELVAAAGFSITLVLATGAASASATYALRRVGEYRID